MKRGKECDFIESIKKDGYTKLTNKQIDSIQSVHNGYVGSSVTSYTRVDYKLKYDHKFSASGSGQLEYEFLEYQDNKPLYKSNWRGKDVLNGYEYIGDVYYYNGDLKLYFNETEYIESLSNRTDQLSDNVKNVKKKTMFGIVDENARVSILNIK